MAPVTKDRNSIMAIGDLRHGACGRRDDLSRCNCDAQRRWRPRAGKPISGAICFAVDDQTVAKTKGGGTGSPAGFVESIGANGILVRFDKAPLRNHAEQETMRNAEPMILRISEVLGLDEAATRDDMIAPKTEGPLILRRGLATAKRKGR